MTNAVLLKIAIVRNGMSVLSLCEKCGFSAAYFYKVLRGEQDFRVSEVQHICNELSIGTEEMNRIFFSSDVDKVPSSSSNPPATHD